jgi:DeoR/GlpR family transcriptional regulator of sugar metabolism
VVQQVVQPSPRHKLPAHRREEILRAVRSGAAHVGELAQSLGVSEMTVRRDLRELARDGKLERVRGGAVSSSVEPPFEQTVVERYEAKDRVGAAAAALVREGQTVMIDIGTTTLQAAHHLHGSRITVVTSSLAVYEELLPDPAIELLLPGGLVRRNYRSLVGVLAEDSLRQLKADVLFLGTSAVDAELAVWDSTMVEVPIKRAMIAAADRVVLLADAEKFSMQGSVRVCEADAIDHIVTDDSLPAEARAAIDQAGIEVTIA